MKVTEPVGLYPPVRVAVSFNVTPTTPPALGVVARDGLAKLTVTVFVQVLFPSSNSVRRPLGSTLHVPPVGFTRLPAALVVTGKLTVKLPVVAIDTGPPFAVQVSTFVVIEQDTLPVIPLTGVTVTAP